MCVGQYAHLVFDVCVCTSNYNLEGPGLAKNTFSFYEGTGDFIFLNIKKAISFFLRLFQLSGR